jgi:hypothetical protein
MNRFVFQLLALAAVVLGGVVGASADYSVTQGAGTTMLSRTDAAGKHAPAHVVCDATNPDNCANVVGSGALKVDGSATTQPVSAASLPLPAGAATAAKQPAPGTPGAPSSDVLSVQGAPSMTPLKVDGSATTQPVSAASLPLPAGAATAAKQPAPGTAGSPSSDVLSVQGAPSMTPLKVDGSATTQPVSEGNSAAIASSTAAAATAAGAPSDSAWGGSGNSTIIAALKAIYGKIAALFGTAGSPSTNVITVQGASSMTPLKIDGSATTQPVSAASLPLPSGAATAAKQPSLGTAGTPASDVLSMQGVPGGTAVNVSCTSGCAAGSAADQTATLSGMAALNAATQIALAGTNSVSVQIAGTWTGTIVPEISFDGGTSWVATQFYRPDTQAFASSVATNGSYNIVGTAGASHARVRLSAYSSGTVTGQLRAVTQAADAHTVQVQGIAGGTAVNVSCTSGCAAGSAADQTATLSGMTAANAATQIALAGTNSVSVQIGGTWVGTIVPEISVDGGTSWIATQFYRPDTQAFVASVTSNGTYNIVGTAGASHARVRLSAYSSGTVTGQLRAVTQGPDAHVVQGAVAVTGTPAVNQSQIGGTPVDTNSGNKSAGTQRVVIATDQPQLANALKVDGSAVTQPVSASSLPLPTGAATAAKQPAPGTAGSPSADVISVQGAPSMTPLKVDGSATTQPVSAASLPLPSGAATSAKQPAPGTAGSPSPDVISVQGAPSMTPLKVDGSATTQPVSESNSSAIASSTAAAATAAGAPSDSAWSGSGNSTIIAALKAIYGKIAALFGTAGSPSTNVLTVQGTSSMTPLKTDGSATTQPVSAVSLPLPSGAATSAKQPAPGTAGSPSADVLSMQGVAGGTPLNTSDSTSGSTGSAVPSKAAYIGANNSGNLGGLIGCDHFTRFNDAASGDTQLVALSSGKTIYICGMEGVASGTVTAQLEYGTGTNCATGKTAITDAMDFIANTGIVSRAPFWSGMKTAASNALCLNLSAAVKLAGGVYWTQF